MHLRSLLCVGKEASWEWKTGANAPSGPRKGGPVVLDSFEQESDSRLQGLEFKKRSRLFKADSL